MPSYTTDTERRAYVAAAQTAGLNVLRLFNETTSSKKTYTVKHTMYASVYIYSVHSVWFRFAIFKNAVLFFLYFGAVSSGYRR